MSNFTLTFKFNENDYRVNFSPPIILSGPSKVALISIDLYNVFKNVTKSNNIFRYSELKKEVREWKEIIVPTDYYDGESLADFLNEKFSKRTKPPFQISYDENNSQFEIDLYAGTIIDFTHKKSMHDLFGFEKVELYERNNKSTTTVDLDPIKSVFLECDIVDGNRNYLNGEKSKVLFNFPIDCDLDEKVHAEPENLIYVPVVTNEIRDIGLRLKDYNNNLLDLRKTAVVVKLDLMESRKY